MTRSVRSVRDLGAGDGEEEGTGLAVKAERSIVSPATVPSTKGSRSADGEGVGLGLWLGLGEGVGLGLGMGVAVGEGEGLGDGLGSRVGEGEGTGQIDNSPELEAA